MKRMTEEDDGGGMELSRVARETFAESESQFFNDVAGPGHGPEATFETESVFLGWNRGDIRDFEALVKRARSELPDASRNEAIMEAIQMFKEFVGGRREPVFMDRGEPDVMFAGGERGAGKTFVLRAISNRSAKAGATNILIDPEHEYYTNNQYDGIQSHLKNLRERESPINVDTAVVMPYFVWKARKEAGLPERGYTDDRFQVFKFEFGDLDPNDLQFVLTREFKDHPDFYIFTSELASRISGGGSIRTWDDVVGVAQELEDRGEFQWENGRADQIRVFLEHNYQKWEFLGPDKKIDLEQLLNDHNTITLSLHDDGFLPDNLYMKELYVKFLVKRVRTLAQRNRVPTPVDWVIDEAHEYAPAHTEPQHPPSKQEIRRAIKKDRKRGFRVNMASQEPTDVAEKNFLNQSKHMLVPRNMKPTPRNHLLSKANLLRSGDFGRDKWDVIFEAIKENLRYGWLYADADRGYWCVLEPASPLANHREAD